MRLLTQKEIDEIREAHYNWDKIFKKNMENKTVQIKGKAYPKAEFFFKHAHPHRWKFHQFIKHFFKLFGANVKFNYPD